MKNTSKPATKPVTVKDTGKRPENKDNLDSREGEEQLTKGDDITHNKKEKNSDGKK